MNPAAPSPAPPPLATPPASARAARAHDALALAFVLAVTAVLLVLALDFVSTWAGRIPVQDDLEMACFLVPGWQVSWGQLWQQANEHRIVLPRLVFLGLLFNTHDFRSPMFLQVCTHALLALGMVLLVRRLRGRTRCVDAFFPLFWLSLANAENFLLGMQIATDLSTVLVCGGLALLVWDRRPPGRLRALGLVAVLLLLPLNGGFGLSQVPALGLAGAIALGWNARERDGRGAAWVLAVGLVLVGALIALYMQGLRSAGVERAPVELGKLLVIAGQVLTLNLGPAAHEFVWPAALLTAAVTLTAIGLCVRAAWRDPVERWRALACLCVLGAPITTALAIGLGRQEAWPVAGWADRYVTLPSTLFATAFVVFVLFGGPLLGRAAQGLFYSAFLLLVMFHHERGHGYGSLHAQPIAELFIDARAGTPIPQLAQRHARRIYANVRGLRDRLEYLRAARMPPFDHLPPDAPELMQRPTPAEGLGQPIRALRSPAEPAVRYIRGEPMLYLVCDGEVEIDVPADAERVRGTFAVPQGIIAHLPEEDAARVRVRFTLAVRLADDSELALLERVLQPGPNEDDRGPQGFDVELPAGSAQLLLRVASLDAQRELRAWAALGGVSFSVPTR